MARYKAFKEHIDQIALRSKRNPSEITLIAVSKNQPIDPIQAIYDEGCRDFGENRIQEALTKIPLLPDCRWHFIGSLQTNKVNKAVSRFALIHSVDSFELALKISLISGQMGHRQSILLQLNISGEHTKQGFSEEECHRCLKLILDLPNLSIEGLMTMAPLTEDKELIRHCFRRLRELRDEFQVIAKEHGKVHASFQHLSMGMSEDYAIAIEEGATLLRIGRAIFDLVQI